MTPDELRAWMNRHPGTIALLARTLGISRSQLYRYLDGRSPISGPVATALLALEKLCGPRTPLLSMVEQLRS